MTTRALHFMGCEYNPNCLSLSLSHRSNRISKTVVIRTQIGAATRIATDVAMTHVQRPWMEMSLHSRARLTRAWPQTTIRALRLYQHMMMMMMIDDEDDDDDG